MRKTGVDRRRARVAKESVSIIIPTYNEAKLILFTLSDLERVARVLRNMEILIVDSGSVDGTFDYCSKFATRFPNIKVLVGPVADYGGAVMRGLTEARGKIIVTFDADGHFDAAEIPKLIKPLAERRVDLILGSRYRGEMRTGSTVFRERVMTMLMNALSRLFLGIRLTDSATTLRVIRKATLLALKPKASDFLDLGLLKKAVRADLRIVDVPATYRPRSIVYLHPFDLRRLLEIAFRFVKGG